MTSENKLTISDLIGGEGVHRMSDTANYSRTETIAALFGVTVRRVQQLTQEGIIKTTEILDENNRTVRRYETVPTIQKYIQYLSGKAYGKKAKTDKEIELREQKLEADIELKKSQNELHQLKTEIAAGRYISIEEVKMDYSRFFIAFKKFATSLPARVIGMIAGQLDPVEARRLEKDLAEEVNTLLGSFVIAAVVTPKDAKQTSNGNKKKKDPAP